jgi:hypothetical protein
LLVEKPDDDEANAKWVLAVRNSTDVKPPRDEWESAEEIRANINIQKVIGGRGRDQYSYRLGSDGVVRRYDLGDGFAKAQQERAAGIGRKVLPGLDASIDELLKDTEAKIEELLTVSIPNARLAREMGLNDQPISLEEMEGLEQFVRQPGFEVPPTFQRPREH